MLRSKNGVLVRGLMLATIALIAGWSLACGSTVQAAANLVVDGKAQAQIVIAPNPTRSVKLAARELQTYLKKITGAELSIVDAPAADAKIKVYVGQSQGTQSLGISTEGLEDGAYRIVSGKDWLVLVGQDEDFVPPEPWGRNRNDWIQNGEPAWDKITGAYWRSPLAEHMWKFYNKELDIWDYDKRGSLNAVYAYLKSLGVRWYMPGELGEIVPTQNTLELSAVDVTRKPDVQLRKMNFPRFGQSDIDTIIWALRLANNAHFVDLHHGMRNVSERPEQRELHPEYFILVNGKRATEGKKPNNCLSSVGFFNETVKYVKAVRDVYGIKIVSVMPHDGFTTICQCDDCKDKATLDRGRPGWYSDYVWKFVNRVAIEVAKTHPDVMIACGAYSTYRLPPLEIKKLAPNVLVRITNGRPTYDISDEAFKESAELRAMWLEKTDNPLSISLNYPFTQRGVFLPQYFPHVIARGLRESKGQVWGEDPWLPEKGGLYQPGVNHLNAYVMAECWWDADLNVDALLDEYYTQFYGPAAAQMKAFIEYSETNYTTILSNADQVEKTLALFETAKAAADPESVYGKRIALVDDFLKTLRDKSSQLGKGRGDVPEFTGMVDMAKDKWRDVRDTFVLDGKIDEEFWTAYPSAGKLKEMNTGAKPEYGTKFYARWWNGNFYLAIRCDDKPGRKPLISTTENGNPALWDNDRVEILIETEQHSYYQIVVNAGGAMMDLDRGVSKNLWYNWASQADVATHVDDNGWSVEIRFPVAPEDSDPLHNIVGRVPSEAMPWHFNIGRLRYDEKGKLVEKTLYSPTETRSFHDVMKFAKLHVKSR